MLKPTFVDCVGVGAQRLGVAVRDLVVFFCCKGPTGARGRAQHSLPDDLGFVTAALLEELESAR